MAKVLMIRFSAIGDVAMTIPVCFSVAEHYPNDEFVMLSRKKLGGLYVNKPKNLSFFAFDPDGRHKGHLGLFRLFFDLKREGFTAVADLHDVLRSRILTKLFCLTGILCATIDKGRVEKKALVRSEQKQLIQLKSSIDRYKEVFNQLGYSFALTFEGLFPKSAPLPHSAAVLLGQKHGNWVGIAPFAQHKGKIYPLEKMEEVVRILVSSECERVLLFGGGAKERAILESWEQKYSRVFSLAGKFALNEELQIMNCLDTVVAMDSANMHFASLVGTRVVSVWGATHPYAGFYGYKQVLSNAVQVDSLECRPCSIFGNKPCLRNDYACLNMITPQMIVNCILSKES